MRHLFAAARAAPLRLFLAAIAVGALLLGLGLLSPALLVCAFASACLSIWMARHRGPALLLMVCAVAMTAGACTFLRNAAQDAKRCAGQTISDAQWSDLQPAADDALQLDWAGAVVQLEELALRYGREFVKCVVAELHDQYAARLVDAGTAADPADAGQPAAVSAIAKEYRQNAVERARDNAREYLRTH